VAPFDFFSGVPTDPVPEFFQGVGNFKSFALEDGFLVVPLENDGGFAINPFHVVGDDQVFQQYCACV
jgi:hypothetical protein